MSKPHEHLLVVFQMTHRTMCERGATILKEKENSRKMYRCHMFCLQSTKTPTVENYKKMFEKTKKAGRKPEPAESQGI